MNRHEYLYRVTGRALVVLLGLWVAVMLLALALPKELWRSGPTSLVFFDGVFPLMFVAMTALSVLRIISYVRWTGKYPVLFPVRQALLE